MNNEPNSVDAEITVPEELEENLPAVRQPDTKPPTTAAQAKVEAVANLTMTAYARASTLSLTPEEIKALSAEFPDEAFQPGAAGKEHLIYIEHAHLRDRLNAVFGPGQWAVVPRSRWNEEFRTQKGTPACRVYVEAMLLVRGCFVGEAVGDMVYYPGNESQNYGDAVEGAKTAALRRCCKELGIGLQAWKKEFCEGWWKRRRSGPAPRQHPVEPPKPAKPCQDTAHTTKTPQKPPQRVTQANESFRAVMIGHLDAGPGGVCRDLVTGYFRAIDALLETEELEELPLSEVPVSKEEFEALKAKLAEFENGDPAERAFPRHLDAKEMPIIFKRLPDGTVPSVAEPKEAKQPKDDQWWRDIIVPIPHKGQSRAEYLKNPETLGSLYEARHGDDENAQIARQRLWGFVTNYQPKPWTKRDGTQMPPSESDVNFREALDAFMEFFKKNHPDEKL